MNVAFWNRDNPSGARPADPANRGSLVAAAAQIDLTDVTTWQKIFRLGDNRWQYEAWRHYDLCGEMRFVVNWVGSALSRCRMYAAQITDTGEIGDEVEDAQVKLIAETMFGSPAAKALAQKLMGIDLMTVGEFYVVAEGYARAEADKWYILAPEQVIRKGNQIVVRRSIMHGGGEYELVPKKDLIIRVWNPHPRRFDAADSTVRAVLPTLRKLESVNKRIFAELDSRLAGNGLLILPDNIDFPAGPGDEARSIGSFMKILERAMAASLQQRDSAAAVVPIGIQVPPDAIGKIQHLMFDSKLSDQLIPLYDGAVKVLATSLDVPAEVLMGMGDTNHWSAWQVEETTIKIHIEPVLIQIADALNIGYFQPALKAAKVANPEKMTLWFDTSALTVRPNRSDQAFQAQGVGIISDEAARKYADFTDEDAPDDKERAYRLVEKIVLAQPNFAADPQVQKILGLPAIQPAPTAAPPGLDQGMLMPGQPGYDQAGTEPADAGTRALPTVEEAESGGSLAVPGKGTGAGAASLRAGGAPHPVRNLLRDAARNQDRTDALYVACDAAVRRALEVAGGRLVGGPGRDRYARTPRHELHTQVVPDASRVPSLLAGAWAHVREQASDLGYAPDPLVGLLEGYATQLLVTGTPHSRRLLEPTLEAAHRGMT